MENPQKQQVAERLKAANNILVTVSSNPSVDQLSACIGLTLALNKMGKHATAVFSGQVPSTIEFLQPEKTLEKNTDSLRDFIIALDKSKADKLRYKVEDKVVKIFITPYKTSISEKDLEFSQGDFNVDVVVALGVHNQADLDQAITAHGRILHDAVVTTINVKPGGELGAVNWLDAGASSLSELVVELIDATDKKVLDGQIATSLLTGIVAETSRFSNAKTSPQTMSISAELMSAGANQQLVATKLEPKPAPPPPQPIPKAEPKPALSPLATPSQPETQAKPKDEGTLEIEHNKIDLESEGEEEKKEPFTPQIDIDREGILRRLEEQKESASVQASENVPNPNEHIGGVRKVLQPPTLSGQPANTYLGSTGSLNSSDPLSLPQPQDGLSNVLEERPSGAPPLTSVSMLPTGKDDHAVPAPPMPSFNDTSTAMPPAGGVPIIQPPPAIPPNNTGSRTLTQIEESVGSPHLTPEAAPSSDTSAFTDLSSARDAVNQAISSQPSSRPLEPIAALNAQPVNLQLRDDIATPGGSTPPIVVGPQPLPPSPADPNAPPPLAPPPMMPPPSQ